MAIDLKTVRWNFDFLPKGEETVYRATRRSYPTGSLEGQSWQGALWLPYLVFAEANYSTALLRTFRQVFSVGGSDLRPDPSRECLGERDFVYCVHVACLVERNDFYSVFLNSSYCIPMGQQGKLFQFMRRSPALSKYVNFIFITSNIPT